MGNSGSNRLSTRTNRATGDTMKGQTNLFVATGSGVFRANRNASSVDVRLLGLDDKSRIRWLLVDVDDPRRLYAATEGAGVWRSDDAGESWSEKNDGLLYKQAYSLAQHPTTKELYVGTEPAAIFKSINSGDSWSELDSLRGMHDRKEWTFPGPPYIPHVRGMSLCRSDSDIIFGAVEEGWLIRSLDGGATWDNIREGPDFDSHTVTVIPNNPRIVVSTSGDGIYRSDDGGNSFDDVSDGISNRYLTHIAVHPSRPDVLFTAGAEVSPPKWGRPGGPGAEFYRSDDTGKSWRRLDGDLPARLEAAPRSVAGDPTDPDTLFVGLNDGDIWMSADGGEGFMKIFEGLPPVLGICASRH